MSLQEKKSSKGTPYAIIKFSDKNCEFELFLFAELLVSHRELLKESETFVLTLQQDTSTDNKIKKRVNIRKIVNLDKLIETPYPNVTIELKNDFNLDEIKSMLSAVGETKVKLVLKDENKKIFYSLEEKRKLDFDQLKAIKAKDYVEKITI